jgi:hypothetical protein
VRLQLHALAYNLGNFLRTLATPEPIKDWSLTSSVSMSHRLQNLPGWNFRQTFIWHTPWGWSCQV